MLKLNVGFNRKSGEANYGSRGASVNLELELDSSLASDPERLKDRIRQLFALAKASVDEELGGSGPANQHTGNGNGGRTGAGNGHRRSNGRHATASQVRALLAIADRHGLDLARLLADRFATSDPSALSITEASSLIGELKGAANGNGAKQ